MSPRAVSWGQECGGVPGVPGAPAVVLGSTVRALWCPGMRPSQDKACGQGSSAPPEGGGVWVWVWVGTLAPYCTSAGRRASFECSGGLSGSMRPDVHHCCLRDRRVKRMLCSEGGVAGGGGGGSCTTPPPGPPGSPHPMPPPPPPPHAPPLKRLGQIFVRAFGRSKIFSAPFGANWFRFGPKVFFSASNNSAPPEGEWEGTQTPQTHPPFSKQPPHAAPCIAQAALFRKRPERAQRQTRSRALRACVVRRSLCLSLGAPSSPVFSFR